MNVTPPNNTLLDYLTKYIGKDMWYYNKDTYRIYCNGLECTVGVTATCLKST